MTDPQWEILLRVLSGELIEPLPVGLIVDCPWLPGWAGMTVLDYLSDDRRWLEANLAAARRFPDIMFLPGFWAEYGMCTEPSAFGSKCTFPEDDFPFAGKTLDDYDQIARLKKPDCRTDGLCPLVIKRLEHSAKEIEAAGQRVRVAVSRGPMNIASYLLGHTETLLGVKTNPDEIHRLLTLVTDFVVEWLQYQAARFPSIDGILVLDDLIGFLGEADFCEFVVPYFQRIAGALDVHLKALHNDAQGIVTARHLTEMGFNLFNFSFQHSLGEMRRAAGPEVVLLGNIPPRDVLARGTADEVLHSAAAALATVSDRRRLILSCGGGAPPGAPTANLDALLQAARE